MVYTAMPSIMSGGHMYTYETMHLTEFALVFDYGLDQDGDVRPQGTNAIHSGMLRKVYRMAIAIPAFACARSQFCHQLARSCNNHPPTAFKRRSLIGMRSIISRLTQKELDAGEDVMKLRSTDPMAMEIEGERRRAVQILDRIMEKLGVTNAYAAMRIGDWRDPGPEVVLTKFSFPK